MARNGNIKEKSDVKKNKNSNKRQIIFFIIYVIFAVLVTAGLLVFKNREGLNNKESNNDNNSNENTAIDTRYVITDYKEMYYENPLTFEEKLDYKEKNEKGGSTEVIYFIVSGLKDKNLEDRINKEIKDTAYKYYNDIRDKEEYRAYARIGANFSNILSISISISIWDPQKQEHRVEEIFGLNYNLVTGEKLLFTDVFTSNVPMNYIISELAYEKLAWEVDYDSDYWQSGSNMDNRDTSEYEEIILKNVLDFNSIDDVNREFYLTSSRVFVKSKLGNDDKASFEGILLYKYASYVTIYKKFIVDDSKLASIYETKPTKKRVMLIANDTSYLEEHLASNLYFSVNTLDNAIYDKEIAKKYGSALINLKDQLLEKQIVNIANEYRELARNNAKYGYIARTLIDVSINTFENDYGKENYIAMYIDNTLDRTDIEYYTNFAFKSFAESSSRPTADLWSDILCEIYDEKIIRTDETRKQYFYDVNGKLIAKDIDEFEKHMNNKYKATVEETVDTDFE